MIGLFIGTSEGRRILEYLNEFTDDIYVSTATEYGGETIKEYKYKHLNTAPLDEKAIGEEVDKFRISIIIDASHPYATIVTENIMKICNKKGIKYFRYERPSVVDKYLSSPKIHIVDNYMELEDKLKLIQGTIINTTGSNNVDKFMEMGMPNRIVHKVLPTKEVLTKLYLLQVPIENIVAIHGGGSKEFNKALFQEYNAQAIILKDSGKQGRTEEKIEAALELGIDIFIIGRKSIDYKEACSSEYEVINNVKNYITNK